MSEQNWKIPECNSCGEHINWNKAKRAELGTNRPLTMDCSKVHDCDPQKKALFQAKKLIAESENNNSPTKQQPEPHPRQQITLPTTNEVQDPLLNTLALIPTSNEKISEYLLTIVEQNNRLQDIVIKLLSQLEYTNYYNKKIHDDIVLDQELSRKLYGKIIDFDDIVQTVKEKLVTEVEVIGDREFVNGKPVFEDASKMDNGVRGDI